MRSSTIITVIAFVLITADVVGFTNLLRSQQSTPIQIPPQPSTQEVRPAVAESGNSHLTQLLNEKRFLELEEELRLLIDKKPNNQDYRRLYAMVLYFNEKCHLAIDQYDKLINDLPRDMDLRLGRARCHLILKDFNASKQDYNYVLERQINNPDAIEGLQQIKKSLDYEQIASAEIKAKNRRKASLLTAQNFERNHDFSKAIQTLKEILSDNPKDLEIKIKLAKVLELSGNIEDSKALYQELKSQHPEHIDILIAEGFFLLHLRDYANAMSDFQKAIHIDPNNQDAQYGLDLLSKTTSPDNYKPLSSEVTDKLKTVKRKIAALFNNKNYHEAEDELRGALQLFPQNSDLEYELARSTFFQNKYPETHLAVNKLIQKYPFNTDYYNLRGNLYLAEDKLSLAENDFRASLRIDRSSVDALNGLKAISRLQSEKASAVDLARKRKTLKEKWDLASIQEQSGKFSDAIPIYLDVLKQYPGDIETQIRLGRALSFDSRTAEAEDLFTKLLESHPSNTEIILARAQLYLNNEKLDLAEKDFKVAETIAANDPEVKSGLKRLSDRRQQLKVNSHIAAQWSKADADIASGEYSKALQIYEQILDEHPDHFETEIRLAWTLRANGQKVEAKNVYERLLNAYPKNSDIWIGLGNTLFDMNHFFDAENCFITAKRLLPENAESQSELDALQKKIIRLRIQKSAEIFEDRGDLIIAENRIKQALQVYPDDPDLLFHLARLQSRLDKLDDSLQTYNQLISLQAENADYLVGKSLIYKKQGKLQESEEGLRKALDISPNHPDALMGMAMISTAQKDYFRAGEILNNILEKDASNSQARDRQYDLNNFVRDRVIVNSAFEKFSTINNRTTHHAEYFHPFDSSLRGSLGVDMLRSGGNTDQAGFISANKDIFRATNIGGKVSVAPDSILMPRTTAEGEITQGIPETPLSLLMLYRYMNFSATEVHLYAPGILYNLNDHFSILTRAYLADLNNGTTQTGLVKFNYKANPYFTAYIGGSIGTGSSGITASNQLIKTTTTAAQTGFNITVTDKISAGFNYEHEEYKNQFTRDAFGLSIQFLF